MVAGTCHGSVVWRYGTLVGGEPRRTPTWRAKYRMWGSGKPLRFEHWGACEDLSLTVHALTHFAISRLGKTNSQHKGHKIYTGSGHRCGVIPYSSVVWWIASWAEDEQLQREERPPEQRCSCDWRACVVSGGLNDPPLLRWWLVLFIEALVLFPNIEREGIPQRPSLKGDS